MGFPGAFGSVAVIGSSGFSARAVAGLQRHSRSPCSRLTWMTRSAPSCVSRTITFAYNSSGKLVDSWTSGAGGISMRYDGLERRTARFVPWQSHYYQYDGEQVPWEGSDCCWEMEYTYYPGTDRPHSAYRSRSQMRYYPTDQLGSVIGMTDANDAIVNQQRYARWGEQQAATAKLPGTSETVYNRLQYAGREYDIATGLVHMRARYYDPALGRFISEDPIGFAGGINPYAYAGNDPVNTTDPYGKPIGWIPCVARQERLLFRASNP